MKKQIMIVVLLVGITIGISFHQVWSKDDKKQAEEGLVCYMKFDEGEGEKVADSSGNKNDGFVSGSVIWGSAPGEAVSGNALQFDGYTYAEIPHSPNFNLSQLTIECWIKTPEDFGGANCWRALVGKQNDGVFDRDYNFYVYSAGGTKVEALHFSSARFGASTFDLPEAYEPETWHHVAITIDSAGLTKYYSDGVNFASYEGTPGNANNDYVVTIGKADNYYKGIIDEVKIYNRALAADEIKAEHKKNK
jgi:hypothetical protein